MKKSRVFFSNTTPAQPQQCLDSASLYDKALNRYLEQFLVKIPNIVHQSLNDYRLVIADTPLDDIKRFVACHLAGRSLLLHVQELVRLADSLAARVNGNTKTLANPDLDDLLRQASAAILDLQTHEDPIGEERSIT